MKEPVIIIGAPRSGTNMLRDMLVELDNVETWPCDEINYIWRHGNLRFPNDKFTADMATPKVKKFLHKQFDTFKKKSNATVVVEKTCANTLRVDFLNAVFPDAKFIFIVRDGADVIGSAKQRWTAKIDIPYIMKKVRYVPFIDIPFYASRYAWHRIYKLLSKEERLASWGPVLPNMDRIVASNSLLKICAIQWKECVAQSREGLKKIDESRVYSLRYEDFVKNPATEFRQLAQFIGKKPDNNTVNQVVRNVSTKSLGKGRAQIPVNEYQDLNNIIHKELKINGYQCLGDK